MVEDRIIGVVGENNPIVESVISNVAIGAGDPSNFEQQTSPHLGKVTVAFVEFENGMVNHPQTICPKLERWCKIFLVPKSL